MQYMLAEAYWLGMEADLSGVVEDSEEELDGENPAELSSMGSHTAKMVPDPSASTPSIPAGPLFCLHCGAQFKSNKDGKGNITRYFRHNHGDVTHGRCEYCGQLFLRTNALLKHYLRRHQNFPAPNSSHSNTLYAASIQGHKQEVMLLLDAGANVNAQSEQYGSALQAASFGGHEQVARLLLDAGADVYSSNELCTTAFNNDFKESKRGYEIAVEMQNKVLGHELRYTLGSMYNFAEVLSGGNKHEKAEEMYREALEGYEKTLASEHPKTLSIFVSLGSVLQAQRKYGEAEAIYQRAVEGLEKEIGPEDTSTLNAVNNLGRLYERLDKVEQAEQMCEIST